MRIVGRIIPVNAGIFKDVWRCAAGRPVPGLPVLSGAVVSAAGIETKGGNSILRRA